jgi:hypothetical protein
MFYCYVKLEVFWVESDYFWRTRKQFSIDLCYVLDASLPSVWSRKCNSILLRAEDEIEAWVDQTRDFVYWLWSDTFISVFLELASVHKENSLCVGPDMLPDHSLHSSLHSLYLLDLCCVLCVLDLALQISNKEFPYCSEWVVTSRDCWNELQLDQGRHASQNSRLAL